MKNIYTLGVIYYSSLRRHARRSVRCPRPGITPSARQSSASHVSRPKTSRGRILQQARGRHGNDAQHMRLVRLLDSAFASAPELPVGLLCLYRGLREASGHRMHASWRVGTVKRFAGFTSTSPVLMRALLYTDARGCLLRLHVHSSSSSSSSSSCYIYSPREEEILLPRDTCWRLVRKARVPTNTLSLVHPRDPDTDYAVVVPRHVWILDLVQIQSSSSV